MASIKQIQRLAQPIIKDLNLHHVLISFRHGGTEYAGECIVYSVKHFSIVVGKHITEAKDITQVLAHELRHVYQYVNGMLSTDGEWWNGTCIRGLAYEDLPQEKDANEYMKYWAKVAPMYV